MPMEFWGVEVKAGTTLKVDVDDDFLVHLSQAALGESKKDKGNEPVVLNVTLDSKRLVLGTLSRENIPHIAMDIVFHKEFELSHSWKNGSVYFCGYKANQPASEESGEEFSDEELQTAQLEASEEEAPQLVRANDGKASLKIEQTKASTKDKNIKTGASKKQVRIADDKKPNEDDDSEDDDGSTASEEFDKVESDESDESGSGESDEEMFSDSDSDSDNDDNEEEEKKLQDKGKKRAAESAPITPVAAKKSKPLTPQNAGAKKGGHTATPYPSKKAGKVNAGGDRTPKSAGQFLCSTCGKSLNSEAGLQQHSKAKHGDK